MGVDTFLLRLIIYLALFGLSFFSRAQVSYIAHELEPEKEVGAAKSNSESPAQAEMIALIDEMSKFYQVNFLYSRGFIPPLRTGLGNLEKYSLKEALSLAFAGTDVEYIINNKTVLLRKRDASSSKHIKSFRKEEQLPTQPVARETAVLSALEPLAYCFPNLWIEPLIPVLRTIEISPPDLEGASVPEIRPVRLGPAYVLPRRKYEFLEKMGEPVKKLSPDMRMVVTDYGNHPLRETDEILYKYRLFNFSVLPGLGSSGLNPGSFYNGVSLNLTVDYSAGNNIFGLAGISNFSKYSAYGIQLAGLVNLVGGDLRTHRSYTRSELNELRAPFTGVQLAGLGNIVTGDVDGFEGSLVFNLTGGSTHGWQLSALSNLTAEKVVGLQSSLLLNYSGFSIEGVQLSAFNFTGGSLHGLQLGLLNRSRNMSNPAFATLNGDGMQLGLFNFSGNMGGYQLGVMNSASDMNGLQMALLNLSDNSRGYHIGVVNVFRDHQGYAFGLLNIGGNYAIRVWANETFPALIGISTGTDKISNLVFYGRNLLVPFRQGFWPTQTFGYGISKGTLFDIRDLTFLEYVDYRCNFSWVNFSGLERQPFNLLINPHLVYGRKMSDGLYFTIGGGLNAWWMPHTDKLRLSSLEMASFSGSGNSFKFWPGLTIGLEMID